MSDYLEPPPHPSPLVLPFRQGLVWNLEAFWSICIDCGTRPVRWIRTASPGVVGHKDYPPPEVHGCADVYTHSYWTACCRWLYVMHQTEKGDRSYIYTVTLEGNDEHGET